MLSGKVSSEVNITGIIKNSGSISGQIIKSDGVISGKIFSDGQINGTIQNDGAIFGNIETTNTIGGHIDKPDFVYVPIDGEYEIYSGEYVVTPSAHGDQVLETVNKVLYQNVTVLEIPTYETSNVVGTTFIIGD